MRKGKKYNEEKVLYLASREKGLNVATNEPAGTDLSHYVKTLLRKEMIALVGSTTHNNYYKLTDKGLEKHKDYKRVYREMQYGG